MSERVFQAGGGLRRRFVMTAVIVSASVPGCSDRALPQIRVGPPVQVSAERGEEAHYEVVAAAHPTEAGRLLVGSMLQPAGSGMVSGSMAYVSEDGGGSWRPVLETPPADARPAASGDPAVAWGPDGAAYFVASLIPQTADRSARGMLLYRSDDGGSSWFGPARFTYSDREYITIDGTGGPYHGRIHVNGNGRIGGNAGGLTSFHSTDGGRSFTEAMLPAQPVAPVMGNAVVLSDGTLLALHSAEMPESRPAAGAGDPGGMPDAMRVRLLVSASRDGGESFEAPRDVAVAALVSGRKGGHNNTSNLPVMAVDASGRRSRDRLYVVWPEHDAGGTSIRLSVSADRGVTWSAPVTVGDAATPGRDDFMPAVAVNREGIVGVTWYDRRDREDDLGWDVRFAASLDGGASYLPSVRVSAAGMRFGDDDAWIVESRVGTSPEGASTLDLSLNTFTFLGGDTAGLVADAAGVFHAVWVDNSSGLPQVWTASVTVDAQGTAGSGPIASDSGRGGPIATGRGDAGMSAGSPDMAATGASPDRKRRRPGRAGPARDVTGLVSLEAMRPRYDRATDVLTVEVRLINESTQPLRAPIVLAAAAIRSELGAAAASNADSTTAGATRWYFEPGTGETLAPGSSTETRTLAFRITELRPFREGSRFLRGLAGFTWTATVY